MTLRRATERFREVGSLPLLLAALLIAASGDLSAQDRSRSRSNDSSDSGRTATPRAESAPPRSSPPSEPPRSASPSPPSSSDSPSASSTPSRRRAVPSGPGASEPRRQPPSRDRNDPDWRGGRGGDWYGHGGYYYPRWYRSYGPGWWWAPYGYWGWWWLGDNYWPYDPYYYDRGYYDRRSYGRDEAGALDLDISPGRTQVHLDGQYIGTVDQYDGFPTYLWLERGTYDIVFYLDGYKTLARQITVYPGSVIDMEDRLEPGESVRPEDLVSKSHERRDERLRYEDERRRRIERGEDPADEDEDWRDRVRRREREDRRDRGEEIEIEDEDEGGRRISGMTDQQGRVRLDVEPDDASIYLDGQFVGTARDLASLRRGLLVEPGKHTVAVVRPGREGVEREFEVDPGEEVELDIELDEADR